MSAPICSSPFCKLMFLITPLALKKAASPPGTIPSSMAALVAPTASLTLSFFVVKFDFCGCTNVNLSNPPGQFGQSFFKLFLIKIRVRCLNLLFIEAILASIAFFGHHALQLFLHYLYLPKFCRLCQIRYFNDSKFCPYLPIMIPPVKTPISSKFLSFYRQIRSFNCQNIKCSS